jgi:hypothetical protein
MKFSHSWRGCTRHVSDHLGGVWRMTCGAPRVRFPPLSLFNDELAGATLVGIGPAVCSPVNASDVSRVSRPAIRRSVAGFEGGVTC